MPDGKLLPMRAMYVEVGRLIRAHRNKQKLSQEGLARRIGHSRTSVTNIEAGRQRIPLDLLFALGNALHVDARDLLPAGHGAIAAELQRKIPRQYDDSQVRALSRVVSG